MSSPSLRGSGLKFFLCFLCNFCRWCLPLYEGVDWNSSSDFTEPNVSVSLFTREWIEIEYDTSNFVNWCSLPLYEGVDWNRDPDCIRYLFFVSLFTREWIEICIVIASNPVRKMSPSLRGSGLKSVLIIGESGSGKVSLFTREWIEIFCWTNANKREQSLPLYEGVDWNQLQADDTGTFKSVSLFTREWIEIKVQGAFRPSGRSPSLRGSGLKYLVVNTCYISRHVSLFTREWIEILSEYIYHSLWCLPLYEGVDWNNPVNCFLELFFSLPLYEGVDWNSFRAACFLGDDYVSLFTREWIEMMQPVRTAPNQTVSLFTREWIEITCFRKAYCVR